VQRRRHGDDEDRRFGTSMSSSRYLDVG
jgi:hypothetical protein